MAGGVNPFGFSMGVLPAPRAPRQPKDLPSAPFGFTPPPSKMQQTLAILNEYNPLPMFERLMKSPMASGGEITDQNIGDGLGITLGLTGASAFASKPANALNMGIKTPDWFKKNTTEYQGEHKAPDFESGSPMWDVSANGVYPKDFYSPEGLRYYGTGSELDASAYSKIKQIKDNPDALVKVWRAIPWDGKKPPASLGKDYLNPRDWVTISRQYAIDHGENALGGKYAIVATNVPAKELYTAGDSFLEWGWSPKRIEGNQ